MSMKAQILFLFSIYCFLIGSTPVMKAQTGKFYSTDKELSNSLINAVYQEMAEHYGTAIIPARVRSPKDKPNAEGSVGNISTWITASLRNEQFVNGKPCTCHQN